MTMENYKEQILGDRWKKDAVAYIFKEWDKIWKIF